jgi:hypothetical protein
VYKNHQTPRTDFRLVVAVTDFDEEAALQQQQQAIAARLPYLHAHRQRIRFF